MYSKALSYLLTTGRISTEELFSFLEKQNLLSLLPQILFEVREREEELKEKETLLIESPFSVTDENVSVIKDLLGVSKETILKKKEKKDLLSGFRATYHHKSYDASGRKIINELIK